MHYNSWCITVIADDMALFQNQRGLHCDSPTEDFHTCHMPSFLTTDSFITKRSAGLRARLAGLLYYSLSFYRGLFCSGPHSKLAVFCVSWEMGQNSIPKNEYAASRTKEPIQALGFIPNSRRFLHIWECPSHLINVLGHWIFRVYFLLCILPRPPTFLFVWYN